MKSSVLVLLASGVLAGSSASAADCTKMQFHFVFGVDTQGLQIVKSGKICPEGLNVHGGGITDMHIQQPAQHGIVGMAGKYRWAYKSNGGYVGKDSYVVQISGESISGHGGVHSGTTNIQIDVDVVP